MSGSPLDSAIAPTADRESKGRRHAEPYIQEWIDYAYRCTPLSEAEWQVWEGGARTLYEMADVPWPGVVVRVPSPLVGALAAPIAATLIHRLRNGDELSDQAIDNAARSKTGALNPEVNTAVRTAIQPSLTAPIRSAGSANCTSEKRWVDLSFSTLLIDLRRTLREHIRSEDAALRPLLSTMLTFRDRGPCAALESSLSEEAPAGMAARRCGRLDPIRQAWSDYVRRTAPSDTKPAVWAATTAHANAHSAGDWWPSRDFVMVSDLPTEVHTEQADGRPRLHNASGPAIKWADGWEVHCWRGTRVPAELIEGDWDAERILAEPNVEVRRCAIERMGWSLFVVEAGLRLIDKAPDPANPDQKLRLYDLPRKFLGRSLRILLCTNATRDDDGTRNRYGLIVPAHCETATAAAAWTFDLPEHDYLSLSRAT